MTNSEKYHVLPHVTEKDQLSLFVFSLLPLYVIVGGGAVAFHVVPYIKSLGILP